MSSIIQITGNVAHRITLDPSLWILDDRKKRVEQFFQVTEDDDDLTKYADNMARLWEKTLKEGVIPTKQTETLFVQKKDISGDWAIPLRHYLNNAAPSEDARSVICHLTSGEKTEISLETAKASILRFAIDGGPIRGEDGPVHLIFGDGSNQDNPITGIQTIEVK